MDFDKEPTEFEGKTLSDMWQRVTDLIPSLSLPKRKDGWITPHCYICKHRLPQHNENCKHHTK